MPDMSASVSLAVTHLLPVAADSFDKDKVTPGILGFVVFAAMAVAVWVLMKSMSKHMRKVDFKEAPDPDAKPSGPSDTPGKAPRQAKPQQG
ncbi:MULTISPECIES: hypothetical protein [unclassified Streptomyces]|uniref:hypothetical protein n=1 Tax=unclassified Streptomyces TaxID=2593676 RepID=UPI0034564DDD